METAHDLSEIEHGMYVLNVDLWDENAAREVNLVRHSSTSPSISATMPVSYAQVSDAYSAPASYPNILPGHANIIREGARDQNNPQIKYEGNGPSYPGQTYNPYPGPPQVNPYAGPQSGGTSYGGPLQNGYPPSTNSNYPPQNGFHGGTQPIYYTTGAQIHAGAAVPPQQGIDYAPASQSIPGQSSLTSYGGRPFTPNDLNLHRQPISSTQPSGMFTRNLIGSLAASAFRLTDPDDKIGIWFVLQDLSVRTEGIFRYVSRS